MQGTQAHGTEVGWAKIVMAGTGPVVVDQLKHPKALVPASSNRNFAHPTNHPGP